VFITGLDLLDLAEIKEFFSSNSNLLYNFNFVCYLQSLDSTPKNLNNIVESKKLFIQKQLNLLGIEKNYQTVTQNNKILRLFEINNLIKLTKESFVFDFNFVNNDTLPTFEKINLYVKEYKDIFEQKPEEEKKEEVLNYI
jgi:hypothetical protein